MNFCIKIRLIPIIKIVNNVLHSVGRALIEKKLMQNISNCYKTPVYHNLSFTCICKVEVFPAIESKEFQRFASEYIEKMRNMGNISKNI